MLFDAPGPIGRRRIRIATVISVILGIIALAIAIRQFAISGQLDQTRWSPYGTWPMWQYLLRGLWSTLLAAALATAIAAIFGLLLAFGRLSNNPLLRLLAKTYIEVVRVIPALLLVYIVLFALPRYGLDLPLLWKLVVPLSVSNAAQFAEIFRAGIMSLERGQGEAAAALGMRSGQAMRLVILPQAIRRIVPSLVSQTVGLLKDTSLGWIVSYAELLFSAKVLANYNHLLIQTYLVVALIYLVINYSLSRFARWLEARQSATAPG